MNSLESNNGSARQGTARKKKKKRDGKRENGGKNWLNQVMIKKV